MNIDEKHLIAIFTSSGLACELLDLLPDSDLVMELKNIINLQYEIALNVFTQAHFDKHSVDKFLDHLVEVDEQIERLRNAIN